MTDARRGPTYDLSTIKRLVGEGRYHVTGQALDGLGELDFDRTDVVACIMQLGPHCFHRTMSAERAPGPWQDVYRPIRCGIALCVKLQIANRLGGLSLAVVVSFKRK